MFASLRALPKAVAFEASWYFEAGRAVLMIAAGGRALSPSTMGLPFVVGQILLAAILRLASEHDHDDL